MERLTKVINACGKTVVVYTHGKYEDTTAGEMENEDIRNVMKRLSDYEGTGLTPAQVRELKERNTAKVPDYEGDGCDKDGNIIYDTWICPNCGEKYEVDYDDYEHCPKCGQAIQWENLEGMEDE